MVINVHSRLISYSDKCFHISDWQMHLEEIKLIMKRKLAHYVVLTPRVHCTIKIYISGVEEVQILTLILYVV